MQTTDLSAQTNRETSMGIVIFGSHDMTNLVIGLICNSNTTNDAKICSACIADSRLALGFPALIFDTHKERNAALILE